MSAGALELLQRGELPADFWDWECGAAFRFARDEGAEEGAAGRASSRGRWVQGSPAAGLRPDDTSMEPCCSSARMQVRCPGPDS